MILLILVDNLILQAIKRVATIEEDIIARRWYNDDLLEINSLTVYSNYDLYPYTSCSLSKPVNTGMTFDILVEQGANDREEAALQLALRALFK